MASTPHSTASLTLAGQGDVNEAGLVIRDVDSVQEYVDPRLSLSSRPSAHELDASFSRKISDAFYPDHVHAHRAEEKHRHEAYGGNVATEKGKGDLEKGRERAGVSTETGDEEILYVS